VTHHGDEGRGSPGVGGGGGVRGAGGGWVGGGFGVGLFKNKPSSGANLLLWGASAGGNVLSKAKSGGRIKTAVRKGRASKGNKGKPGGGSNGFDKSPGTQKAKSWMVKRRKCDR